jgi:protease I
VSCLGTDYPIYAKGDEDESWGRATFALFDIVNRQLAKTPYRFFAINGGNDLGGMFLTPAQAEAAKKSLPRKQDWRYGGHGCMELLRLPRFPSVSTEGRCAMPDIKQAKVVILATHGFEQSELEVPLQKLRAAGAQVVVVSPEQGQIRGWKHKDWGESVSVDKLLDEVSADDYDAIVLPGGQINPDLLRINPQALQLLRDFLDSGKVVAAVCHAPWLLIEVDAVRGRHVTSYKSIKTDVVNAGGKWIDREVVTDSGIITSRNPGDLDAFCAKIIDEIQEGSHSRQRAAQSKSEQRPPTH